MEANDRPTAMASWEQRLNQGFKKSYIMNGQMKKINGETDSTVGTHSESNNGRN